MSWRRTREYRAWRIAVIRKGGTCDVCGSIKHRHAHHLNHASYFPEQRFDVKNGVVLCSKCHSHYHNDYHRNTRIKCTNYNYKNFKSLVNYLVKEVFNV